MLNLVIFFPLLTGLAHPRPPRPAARPWCAGPPWPPPLLEFAFVVVLWAGFEPGGAALQWRTTVPWIPALGAAYDVGADRHLPPPRRPRRRC